MLKPKWIGWTGHVARRERREIHTGFLWESQKKRAHYEDLGVNMKIILK
jgi:hypothetical protein